MDNFEFSICLSNNQSSELMENILSRFNARFPSDPKISVHSVFWDDYRTEMNAVGVYRRGPDISQTGGPMINDLVALNALRPFNEREMAALGGRQAFSDTAWQGGLPHNSSEIWSCPWMADPRVVVYWRDLLDKAKVNERTAFDSFSNMEDAFERLKASGIATPWVLPNASRLAALQTAVSWIWGAGGALLNPEGTKVLFNQPNALEGLHHYFALHRYMPLERRPIDFASAYQRFSNRQAAATMANLGPVMTMLQQATPELRRQLGITLPPGPPYVGGSCLVVWQHTQHEAKAVELTQFLLHQDVQVEYCQAIGYLPVSEAALSTPPYTTDPILSGFVRSLRNGRIFPMVKFGGMIEDRLGQTITNIWSEILVNPGFDIIALVNRQMEQLAQRIDSLIAVR